MAVFREHKFKNHELLVLGLAIKKHFLNLKITVKTLEMLGVSWECAFAASRKIKRANLFLRKKISWHAYCNSIGQEVLL